MGSLYDDIECPYCEHSFDLDHDDGTYYNEDRAVETQCPQCDKYFVVHGSMSWSFEGSKADCLNGSPHNFSEWRWLWDGEKDNKGKCLERRYCQDCDKVEQEWHTERLSK